MYVSLSLYIYIYTLYNLSLSIDICLSISLSLYIYIYVYVHIYIYIYIHTYMGVPCHWLLDGVRTNGAFTESATSTIRWGRSDVEASPALSENGRCW